MSSDRGDRTQSGHILGDASRRDNPDMLDTKSMSPVPFTVVRMLTHMTMLLGAGRHLQVARTKQCVQLKLTLVPAVIYYWVFKGAVVGDSKKKKRRIIGVTIINFVCASSLSQQSSSLQSLTRVHSYWLTWERTWNISSDPWVRVRTTQWAPSTCSSAASCNPSSHNNVRSNLIPYSLLRCLVRVFECVSSNVHGTDLSFFLKVLKACFESLIVLDPFLPQYC